MNCPKWNNYFIPLCLFTIIFSPTFGQLKYKRVEPTERVGNFSGIVHDLCFSKSGKTLIFTESNQVCFYDMPSKAIKVSDVGHSKPILSLALSDDSTLLVSGGLDSTVVIWNVQSGLLLKKLDFHHGVVTTVNLNNDRHLLASGSSDRTVVVYDIPGDRIVYRIMDLKSDITVVRFSPDGQLLAVGTQDKLIRFYEAKTGQLVAILDGHKDSVRDLCFTADGHWLYSCGDDSKLIKWDIRIRNQIKIEEVQSFGTDCLLSVDVKKDACMVAGLDSKIIVVTNFETYRGKIGVSINKIRFVPNSGSFLKLAVATRGKGLYLMDTLQFNN